MKQFITNRTGCLSRLPIRSRSSFHAKDPK